MRTPLPGPPGPDTPELRELRSIAATPLGKTPTHLLLSAHAMQATAIAALDAAGALPHPQGAPVRLGQGDYTRDLALCAGGGGGGGDAKKSPAPGLLVRLFGRRRGVAQ